jgi:hypothetical protein
LIADAATARRNMAAREAEATRPLTPDEQVSYLAIVEAERERLGLETLAETLDVIDPLCDGRTADGARRHAVGRDCFSRTRLTVWEKPIGTVHIAR